MKKNTNSSSFFLSTLLFLSAMLFFSGCSSNKQYFSFTPAPPAYVKKAVAPVAAVTPAKAAASAEETLPAALSTEPAGADLTAKATPGQAEMLPEVAALREANLQKASAGKTTANKTALAVKGVTPVQKLTLAQKVVLHKVQKQVKKLNNQAQAAAGPVSNRNAIALILIGIVLAVFATLLTAKLASLFYTLGVLLLLVGLVLLILNYV